LLPLLPAGRVVTSGYLDRDRPQVDGWSHAGRARADGWAADVFEREVS
jgi:hypothetical protein